KMMMESLIERLSNGEDNNQAIGKLENHRVYNGGESGYLKMVRKCGFTMEVSYPTKTGQNPPNPGLSPPSPVTPKVYFKSNDVHACTMTCGGLCRGLNTVIRELVGSLHDMYNVARLEGIEESETLICINFP
ncbi:ATP-dependent 6-phosphofructokinase 6-like protein isoform X1, partial [Tanacetum coccineum]